MRENDLKKNENDLNRKDQQNLDFEFHVKRNNDELQRKFKLQSRHFKS